MSPAFQPDWSRTVVDIHVLSARSSVVTSLNGWQIFGIVVIVVVLAALVGGWYWYQKRAARRGRLENDVQLPEGVSGDNSTGKGTVTTSDGQGQELAMHDLARHPSWISHYGTGLAHPPLTAAAGSEVQPNGSNVPWPASNNSNALKLENMFRADGTDAAAATIGSPADMTVAESAAIVPAASRVKPGRTNPGSDVAPGDAALSAPNDGGKSKTVPAGSSPPPATNTDSDYFGAATVASPSSSPPAAPSKDDATDTNASGYALARADTTTLVAETSFTRIVSILSWVFGCSKVVLTSNNSTTGAYGFAAGSLELALARKHARPVGDTRSNRVEAMRRASLTFSASRLPSAGADNLFALHPIHREDQSSNPRRGGYTGHDIRGAHRDLKTWERVVPCIHPIPVRFVSQATNITRCFFLQQLGFPRPHIPPTTTMPACKNDCQNSRSLPKKRAFHRAVSVKLAICNRKLAKILSTPNLSGQEDIIGSQNDSPGLVDGVWLLSAVQHADTWSNSGASWEFALTLASVILLWLYTILTTTHDLARELAAVVEPQNYRIIYLMQAEVLLSSYHFDAGNLLQGKYHCAGATSLAFTVGLHQCVPTSQTPCPPLVLLDMLSELLYVARRIPGRKELADGFWSVALLNNYFVAASGVPSSIPSDLISARWRADKKSAPFHNSSSFVENEVHDRSFAVHPFARSLNSSRAYHRLYNAELRLSSPTGVQGSPQTTQFTLVTEVPVNAALLRFHEPYGETCETSRYKCLFAASCVAGRLADAHITEWGYTDPILGAVQPLLAGFVDALVVSLPLDSLEIGIANLQTILAAMESLAQRILHSSDNVWTRLTNGIYGL
ncbi:hypothetical protein C8R47DRAFT_1068186 [Mycena vitilis]|nr:hypothetical protein C8R47DRAFT_1068186 [Mycena vitilis]